MPQDGLDSSMILFRVNITSQEALTAYRAAKDRYSISTTVDPGQQFFFNHELHPSTAAGHPSIHPGVSEAC